jgi:hypothetical protein
MPIFCCVPHLAIYILQNFQIDQNWVQELILAWVKPHFHLVYWMKRDSNPQLLDHETSLLTSELV